jgi:hypothetical protein
VATDASIKSHGGSVFWNAYRKRWIMISGQAGGSSSYLGELWFAEADTPTGPWAYARKILTHDKYSFYNPTQHPFFDQQDGRLIYFEGTYTSTFSGNEDKTPRYDYNQMMYRLALDDARLSLPAPVYLIQNRNGVAAYALREAIETRRQWSEVHSIPFFALPPDRPYDGSVPVYVAASDDVASNAPAKPGMRLQTQAPAGAKPLFYALPPVARNTEKASPSVVALWEYHDTRDGRRWYSTGEHEQRPNTVRATAPLCRVWRNHSAVLALDTAVSARR